MARLKEFYKTEVIKKMTEQFGYTSPMQVPSAVASKSVGEKLAPLPLLSIGASVKSVLPEGS